MQLEPLYDTPQTEIIRRWQAHCHCYAGQILLEDTMSHFELAAAADRLLPAPGSNRGYKPSLLIRQLMHLLHSGGRRLEDLRCWRRDGLFLGFPIVVPMPSPQLTGNGATTVKTASRNSNAI